MAHITHFARKLLEPGDREPESARMFRKIADSEEARILLGDFFLRLAASEPVKNRTPHADLLRRMLGEREVAGEAQLENLAHDLDLLREYDLAMAERERFLQGRGAVKEGE